MGEMENPLENPRDKDSSPLENQKSMPPIN
jgi:hypothetical protein